MLMWGLIILAGVVAVPLVIEATRKPMNERTRQSAPGQFVALSGGMTHYRWEGPETGPVVVCIHGLTTPSFVWRSVSAGLADKGFRVLTYDLYGRGFSDRPRGLQDPAFFVRQLNDLLDSQNVEDDVTVIGYSMGGAIAAAFAASQPHGVRRVVLLAPAGMDHVGDEKVRAMIRVPVLGLWLMLVRYPEILRRGIRAEAGQPTSVPHIDKLQEAELDYRGFIPAVHSSLLGSLSHYMKAEHEALQREGVPVFAIWGADDTVIPLSAKDRLSEWNSDTRHYVLDDAGHGLTYTHTRIILPKILDFISAED